MLLFMTDKVYEKHRLILKYEKERGGTLETHRKINREITKKVSNFLDRQLC